MLRKILNFNLIIATALVVSAASAHFANAADAPAFVLHGVDGNDYDISALTLHDWESTPQGSSTYISFEPAQSADEYVMDQLGLKKSTANHIDYSRYNVGAIYDSVKALEYQINQPAENAVFKAENGKVTDFNPGQTGVDLDTKTSIDNIVTALDESKTEAALSINETQPDVKLGDTNDMGIKELVAVGESNFAGSPANRIFNIKVGVQKETGTLVAPGTTFSFNDNLGPVDGDHGFLPELVIKGSEGTIPEFGGGLCQVSSTAFRAAVNAGLPITARRNHSYAVSYYAPQGTDATIYPGVQDLKFVNDTQAYILVWPEVFDGHKLRFSFYGTKDGRQITVDQPQVYDKKPDGSMKATWHRKVVMADGTVRDDTFKSNYQPPALFHKTTTAAEPVPATPAAPTPPQNPTDQNTTTSNPATGT